MGDFDVINVAFQSSLLILGISRLLQRRRAQIQWSHGAGLSMSVW